MQTIGVDDLTAWRTTVKVALDCIPAIRRTVLDTLAKAPGSNTSEVAKSIAYPTTTARRTLEDLHAYGLVNRDVLGQGKADRWTLSGLASGLRGTVPEMSDGVRSAEEEGASI
jgi:predicted transcriptional regulator